MIKTHLKRILLSTIDTTYLDEDDLEDKRPVSNAKSNNELINGIGMTGMDK